MWWQTQLSIAVRSCHYVQIVVVFQCQVSHFLDYEIMLLPGTGRVPCGYQASNQNWVIIKMSLRLCQFPCLVAHIKIGIFPSTWQRDTLGPLDNALSNTACNHTINDFNHKVILYYGIYDTTLAIMWLMSLIIKWYCIMEQVKITCSERDWTRYGDFDNQILGK
jgi:hypothetical protein